MDWGKHFIQESRYLYLFTFIGKALNLDIFVGKFYIFVKKNYKNGISIVIIFYLYAPKMSMTLSIMFERKLGLKLTVRVR